MDPRLKKQIDELKAEVDKKFHATEQTRLFSRGLIILEGHRRSAVVGDNDRQGGGIALEIGAKIQDLEDEERGNGDAPALHPA